MKVRLLSVCLCLLLLAALCPGAACKRGHIFRGKGKNEGGKEPPPRSKGLSKQGLKAVGAAAAAGILGGSGTGLGLLGKGKHKTSHKTVSTEHHGTQRQGQRAEGRPQWRSAAPVCNNSPLLCFVPALLVWLRDP